MRRAPAAGLLDRIYDVWEVPPFGRLGGHEIAVAGYGVAVVL